MINTHLKFEAKIKIHNGSKVVAFTMNNTKFISLKVNDLEDQGQDHQFLNPYETFTFLINCSS